MIQTAMKLILGTAQIDHTYGIVREPSRVDSDDSWSHILRSAAKLGFFAVDTATSYKGAHELLGSGAWHGPVHTKVADLNSAEKELELAKKLSGREFFEVVYFHQSSAAITDPASVRKVASHMLAHGANQVGISVYTAEELRSTYDIPEITVVQLPLNPLDSQFSPEICAEAHSKGKNLIIRSIFLQGLLLKRDTGRARRLPPALLIGLADFFEACESLKIEPMDMCMSYAAQREHIYGVVVGAENIKQLNKLAEVWSRARTKSIVPEIFESIPKISKGLDPRSW